jgi:hypothetical protein
MSTNNRLITLLALVAIVIAVPAAQAAIAQAATFDEKVDHAAAIILGKCVKTDARYDPTGRWIVTYATFDVEDSMKGNAAGQVTIVTPGGSVNGIHQETSGIHVFREGDEHVVFLRNTRLGLTPLYFDQGTFNVAAGEHGQKMIVPMATNVIHIDTQRAMAVAPADEPRTLDAFKVAVAESMKGTATRMQQQMNAIPPSKTPQQKSIWSALGENKLLVALAFVGIAIAGWQLLRRR